MRILFSKSTKGVYDVQEVLYFPYTAPTIVKLNPSTLSNSLWNGIPYHHLKMFCNYARFVTTYPEFLIIFVCTCVLTKFTILPYVAWNTITNIFGSCWKTCSVYTWWTNTTLCICIMFVVIDYWNKRRFVIISVRPSLSSWCGSWIYNYLCNQCLSPLKLWVRIPFMARCT